MNLKDPILNTAAVDEVMRGGEPTISVGGVDYNIETIVAVKGLELRAVFDTVVKASTHNANLLEALEAGGDFRIAFRQKGETDWTRVWFENQDLLKAAAVEEVTTRQTDTLKKLADLLGVDEFTINNI